MLAQFEAPELNFLLILRLWSFKFLEICDLGVKVGSCEFKNAEMGIKRMARRVWKVGLQGVPHFLVSVPQLASLPNHTPISPEMKS